MDIAANLSSRQNSMFAEDDEDNDEDVWGMPKYQQNYSLENLTDEQYLARVLGPQRIGLGPLIPITFFYVVIFITGVIGNVAVCLVIVKNKSMHTATNYYLFSLAISDLMILVLGLPNDLTIYWQQYPWMFGEICCRLRSWVSEMTSYSSVLIIVAFSMERYLAICHPLYSHTMSGFKRAIRIIILVWLLSMISATPYALFTKINYVDRPLGSGKFLPQSAFCALLDDNIYPKNYPVHELSSFVFFFFPMCILVILYIRMGLILRETSGIQRNLPRPSNTPQRQQSNIQNPNNVLEVHRVNNMAANGIMTEAGENFENVSHIRHFNRRLLACCCINQQNEALSQQQQLQHQQGVEQQQQQQSQEQPQPDVLANLENNRGDTTCNLHPDCTVNEHNAELCEACTLLQQQQRGGEDNDSFTPRVRSDKKSITLLLAAVVLAFFLCWAPFHAQRLGYVYFKESKIFRTLNEYLYYISGFLYYLSATVNPILYNLMSLKYRHAFRQTLCGKKRRRNNPQQQLGVAGESMANRPQNSQHRSYIFKSNLRQHHHGGTTGGAFADGFSTETANLPTWSSNNSGFSSEAFRKGQGGFTNGQRVSSNSSSVGGSFGQTSVEIINTSASGGVSSGLGYLTSFEESADPITASSKISISSASGNFPFGNRKKLRSRSDFQAAMKLAQTACSDIVEEDSFSSSVASVLQMKKMEDASILHSPVESEVSESQNIQVCCNKSVASQTFEEEAACGGGILGSTEEELVCPNCEISFLPPRKSHCCDHTGGFEFDAKLLMNNLNPRMEEDSDSGTGSVECLPMMIMKS